MADRLLTVDDVRKLAEEKEKEHLRAAMEKMKKKTSEQEEMHRIFMEKTLAPNWHERLNKAVVAAAERGESEFMVMRFPSNWCTDHGRAINNFHDSWPETLTGVAKVAYETYERELKNLGYRVRAQVLDYPGGLLGDVGLFLRW